MFDRRRWQPLVRLCPRKAAGAAAVIEQCGMLTSVGFRPREMVAIFWHHGSDDSNVETIDYLERIEFGIFDDFN